MVIAALALPIWLFASWPFDRVTAATFVLFLPFVPFIFRYSRVLWMHFDRAIDRDGDG